MFDNLSELVLGLAGKEESSTKMRMCDCLKTNLVSMNQQKLQVA
jgi:hypothetical protein